MVSDTARPFYTRLISGGLSQIPWLSDRLAQGMRVLDMACGAGVGLIRTAQTYRKATVVDLDGDAYSLELTADRLRWAGLQDRVSHVQSTLEDISGSGEFDLVLINVSMHECQDIEKVTSNVYRALQPDGYFGISDFPFPDSIEGTRTVPARIISGIQFFEALIDDQLLPTQAFVDLLNRHGFRGVGAFDLTPVLAVTYGQR
jgi:ubiquinone/menaquinone biosynthesis C-methylase UbiE